MTEFPVSKVPTSAEANAAIREYEGYLASPQAKHQVVTRVKVPRVHSADSRPAFGRDVRYLTDDQLQAFLATEGRAAREWGGRSIVLVDGQPHSVLGRGTRVRNLRRSRGRR